MTGKLSGQIMETGFLTGTKARVLLALASVSDRHGQSWYSYAGLAHLARCSRKSAIEAVKWMEMTGILSVRRGRYLATQSGKTTGASNLYTLNLAFLEALHEIASVVRKLTPGDSKAKWEAVKAVALWAEDQVKVFQWRLVVEIAEHHPHVIMQACLGVEEEAATLPNFAGGER